MKIDGLGIADLPVMSSANQDDLLLIVQNNALKLQSYNNLTGTFSAISGSFKVDGIALPKVDASSVPPTDELVLIVENNGLAVKQVGIGAPSMPVGSFIDVDGVQIPSIRFSGNIDGDELCVAIRNNNTCLIPIPLSFSVGALPTSGRLLFAPLKSSLVLSEGTGSATFSRATKAWGLNELGILEEVPSGCAFFSGARLVRNLCPTPSNTLAVAGTKTVTLTASATLQFSMGAGAGTATFSGTGGATGTLDANASARVSINKSVGAGTFIVTASVADLVDLSITDVTGYDASYVPEYVSVGVASAPFFGAGVDGAKYYETDWQGAPIPSANLLGFRRETAATNNLLYCRDLSNAAWSTKTNITADKTATGLDGIANTATTLTATAADAIILQPITLASAARCSSAYIKRRTGTGTISLTQDGGSSWTNITSQINSSTYSRVQITSTLANPSVGFKISTNGDAIDVDVVQNEAGSAASSPIVTTTATVTRNADSLTYQTDSNIDFTVGTLFGAIQVLYPTGICVLARTDANSGSQRSSSEALTTWTAFDGVNVATKTGLSDCSAASVKRAVSWGGSGLKATGDGLAPANTVFDGSWGSGATLSIGLGASCLIRDVAIYDYQMTDAELQGITA